MKLLPIIFALATLVAVSGCAVRERTSYDPHRQWWSEHHGQEAYDHGRAEQEHRSWCTQHHDQSCEGWR